MMCRGSGRIIPLHILQIYNMFSMTLSFFLNTSKFYPSRRSSKMIAAMKTNKIPTYTHTHTISNKTYTEEKRKKMTNLTFDLDDLDLSKNETLKLISGAALHLPSKFGEDRPKDLGGTNKKTT